MAWKLRDFELGVLEGLAEFGSVGGGVGIGYRIRRK